MGKAAFHKEVSILPYNADDWLVEDGIIKEWAGAGDLADETWLILPATDADLSAEGDVLDDTDLRTTGTRSRIIGLLDWSVSGTLNYEPGISGFDTLKNAFFDRSVVIVRYLPEGVEELAEGYAGPVVVENFSHTGGVEDLETIDFSLPSNGVLLDGTGSTLGSS